MRHKINGRLAPARAILVSFFVSICAMLLASMASAQASASSESHPTRDLGARNSPPETLDSLVEEALVHSPLITAEHQHWQAETRVPIQESTLPDPQVSFQNLAVGNAIPGNRLQTSNFAYFGYGVSQDIPFPGKLMLRAAMAQKDADAARETFEAEEREVVEQIRETYFNLFYLTKALGVVQQTQNELQRVEHITQSQYEVGMGQQQDVLRAQLELTSILNELEVTREQFGQSQADLKAMLGREPDTSEIPVADVKLSEFSLDDHQLRTLALRRSPQFKRAQEMEAKNEQALKLAREDYIPDFSISYMYQKTGAHFPDYYMATVGAKVPLYFWRKQVPAAEQAALEKESARALTHATRLSILSQLQNQLIAIQTTRRVAQLYSQGLIPQAQATLTSALATYRVGKVDFQTLLSAETNVLRLKQQYYRAVADHEIAIARIQQIIGKIP